MIQRHICSLLCAMAIAPIASCQMPRHAPPAARIELPPEGVDLPMLAFKGLPVIEVKIDGKGPFPFILDTGANITVIGEELQCFLVRLDEREGSVQPKKTRYAYFWKKPKKRGPLEIILNEAGYKRTGKKLEGPKVISVQRMSLPLPLTHAKA